MHVYLQDVQWNDNDYSHKYQIFTTDPEKFGDQPKLVNTLHGRGMHYVIIVVSAVSLPFYESTTLLWHSWIITPFLASYPCLALCPVSGFLSLYMPLAVLDIHVDTCNIMYRILCAS